MPLSDWLGLSREEGFLRQLELVAEQLRLEGSVRDGLGLFTVWGGVARHVVTVCLEDNSALLRVFSNVRYPPGSLPRDVVAWLPRWKMPNRFLIWDGHGNEEFSCFLVRCAVRPDAFAAELVKTSLGEMLAEVSALDRLLKENGYHGLPGPASAPALRDAPPAARPQERGVVPAPLGRRWPWGSRGG